MVVSHFGGVESASSTRGLRVILSKRYGGGANEFWLADDNRDGPCLALLVNGDLANLTYFPDADSPGLQSIGRQPSPCPAGHRVFHVNTPEEEIEVDADAVVTFEEALRAACEFFESRQPPTCINWSEI